MVKLQCVPTEKVIREANEKGENPASYLLTRTTSIKDNDIRKMDKYGIEFLEDLMITRTDGTKIILHELKSECSELKKIEIRQPKDCKYFNSKVIVVYADSSLDFKKLQKDKNYLDIVGDGLLSAERLDRKIKEALLYNGEAIIYIGTVGRNTTTGTYEKQQYGYDSVYEVIVSAKQQKRQTDFAYAKKAEENQKRRQMIEAIKNSLSNLSTDKLEQICNELGINPNLQGKSFDDGNRF